MFLKDYYKILEISPAASYAEIKKSYRRLALQYHPDKNFGSQLYEAKFKEIKEAYEILSDTNQRQAYNSTRKTQAEAPKKKTTTSQITPDYILNQVTDFRKKVSALDPDRANKPALFQHIEKLLARKHIAILKQNNDSKLNKRIINELLYCSRFLPYVYVSQICFLLTPLAGSDNDLYNKIYAFSKEVRFREYWNKFKFLAAIIFAVILCFIIYIVCDTL